MTAKPRAFDFAIEDDWTSETTLAEALSRIELGALIFQYGPESPSLPYAIARAVAALPRPPARTAEEEGNG